jgi:hypothetical protein
VIAGRILQDYLDDITTWTNAWRVKPNPLKSQSILMSYSGANNSRSRHQAPPTCIQQPGHPQTPTHPLPRRHLFQKLHPQPGRQRNPQKIPQTSQPPVQDSGAHPRVRSENPVPHLQILHPSRHRIPCQNIFRSMICSLVSYIYLQDESTTMGSLVPVNNVFYV